MTARPAMGSGGKQAAPPTRRYSSANKTVGYLSNARSSADWHYRANTPDAFPNFQHAALNSIAGLAQSVLVIFAGG